jgi:aminoglycoside phosphotransferase (APT) family kinase protein
MATRHSLPYYAPADTLPAPLPTVAEIRASTTRLSKYYESPVFRVGEHFAVKYGPNILLQEAENMLFVRESSNVPLPTVYAAFYDNDEKMTFIVQEFIPGTSLFGAWGNISVDTKKKIALQLRRDMDELRNIPSQGYYGGIWRQPTQDFLFQDIHGGVNRHPHTDSTISGPQETEEQWTHAMWSYLDSRMTPATREQLPYLGRIYPIIFKGHKPVFTHANFGLNNIILLEDETVVIIDWQTSGWYPSYWEYCTTMYRAVWGRDWYVTPWPCLVHLHSISGLGSRYAAYAAENTRLDWEICC